MVSNETNINRTRISQISPAEPRLAEFQCKSVMAYDQGFLKTGGEGSPPPTRLRGFKLQRSSVHNAVEERNLHRLKFCPWLPRHLEGKMSRAINISTLVTSEKCCFLQKNRCTTTLGVGPLVTLLQEIFWIAVSFVMLFEV